MELIIFILLIYVVLYFFMIRPRQRQEAARRELISSVSIGDLVVTSAGIHGAVAEVEEDVVWLEVAPDVELKISKSAIAEVLRDDGEPDELEAADSGDDEG